MRIPISTLTAAAAALALAGCGAAASSDTGGTAASRQDKAFEGALRFARCMRERGVDFPDPKREGDGVIRVGGAPGEGPDPGNPRHKAALEACRHHMEDGGEAPDPAQQAKMQDAFLEYARCMRREGIDMPDPEPGAQGGALLDAGDPNAPDPNSPEFQAADRTCRPILSKLDAIVTRETRP